MYVCTNVRHKVRTGGICGAGTGAPHMGDCPWRVWSYKLFLLWILHTICWKSSLPDTRTANYHVPRYVGIIQWNGYREMSRDRLSMRLPLSRIRDPINIDPLSIIMGFCRDMILMLLLKGASVVVLMFCCLRLVARDFLCRMESTFQIHKEVQYSWENINHPSVSKTRSPMDILFLPSIHHMPLNQLR